MSIRFWLGPPIVAYAILAVIPHASAQGLSSLAGVVFDDDNKPLAGVTITLKCDQPSAARYETHTNQSGEYFFDSLPASSCTMIANRRGYMVSEPILVDSRRRSSRQLVRLQALRLVAHSKLSNGAADETSPTPVVDRQAASTPEFQSSGVRGVIDQGGYSASTDAAASSLLQNMTTVNATTRQESESVIREWPCTLEPKLREAVSEHANDANDNSQLGQFYAAHDQPERAVPLLLNALRIAPDDETARITLAGAWLRIGNYEETRRVLTRISATESDPLAHEILARADEGMGLFHDAVREYHVAYQKSPSEKNIFGLGYELLLAGSMAESRATFEEGVQRFPRSILMRIGAGTAQFLSGDTSAALASFLDAADQEPTDPRPYPLLASLLNMSGAQSERVRKSFQRFYERVPDSSDASYFYALILFRTNGADQDRIEKLCHRAIELNANNAKAHLLLANMYSQRGENTSSLSEYEAAIRLDESLSEAHYRLALAYKRAGRESESEREMHAFRSAQQNPDEATRTINIRELVEGANVKHVSDRCPVSY